MHRRTLLRSLLLCALAVVPLLAAATGKRQDDARTASAASGANGSASDSLAIVVNRANPVDDISFDELRQYFLGERTHWPNGRRVSLVMRSPTEPEGEAVLRLVYRMRERDFHEHFLHARFTGALLEDPRLLDPASRLLNFVFLRTGALGYARASEAASAPVKVLRIDGLLPGDAGYKLALATNALTN